MIIVFIVFAFLAGCDAEYHMRAEPPPPDPCELEKEARAELNWAQDNLKAHDNTCDTMVFIAPGGNLEQCP